jgi:hypothetical protein
MDRTTAAGTTTSGKHLIAWLTDTGTTTAGLTTTTRLTTTGLTTARLTTAGGLTRILLRGDGCVCLDSPDLIGDLLHVLFGQSMPLVLPDYLNRGNRNNTGPLACFQAESFLIDTHHSTGQLLSGHQRDDYFVALIIL